MRLVEAALKTEIANANTPATKTALATKLIKMATEAKDKPAEQFALCSKAREIATQSADATTVFAAIDELSEHFQIDALGMKAESLAKIADAVGRHFDTKAFLEHCGASIHDALIQDKFEIAQRVSESAVSAARKSHDATSLKWATAREAEVRSARIAFDKQKLALITLNQNPADPEANLVVGKYFCFVRDDWKNGLPLLVRGGDTALKSIAGQELAATDDPHADVALADAWMDLAAKTQGPTRQYMWLRAVKWYDDAGPSLTGLARIRAQRIRASLRENGTWLSGNLTPDEVAARFIFPNTTFRIDGDTITGKAGDCDDQTTFVWLKDAKNMESFEFGFGIKSKWYQIAAVDIDGQKYWFSRGHWWNGQSGIFIRGKGEQKFPGAVKNPNDWASIKVVVEDNKMTFYCNGDVAGSCDLVTPMTKSSLVKVGFSSHQTEVSVKDLYFFKK
ncbi:MAG: hypothetical protein JWL69_2206 [Phycisphaerales bacterium]|nr:hypothetical protein [Phycisphaerales bacterium]